MRAPTYCRGYDYGFRNYDAQVGRFTQLDPLTDDYHLLTPYQYANNDPITNIDVDGLFSAPGVSSTGLPDVIVKSSIKQVAAKAAQSGLQNIFTIGGGLIKTGAEHLKKKAINFVKHGGALVLGIANAWSSNQVFGVGRADAEQQGLTDSKGVAFQVGQKIGDVASILTGGAEIGAAGLGKIATLGVATPVAIPVAAHGLSSVGLGLYNLLNGRIVYSTSNQVQGGNSSPENSGGTQVNSKTLWKGVGKERLDVENPNPSQRPGQIHYQDNSGNKFIFDPKTGKFKNAPIKVNDLLKNNKFKSAIEKGLKYLGLKD